MKARIKETGEIINISDYARVTLDKCDSYGSPIELSLMRLKYFKKGLIILIGNNVDMNWQNPLCKGIVLL